MKIELELCVSGNAAERAFLNYWDSISGNDLCCEIIGNKLMEIDAARKKRREITLSEFIARVAAIEEGRERR